MRLALTFLLFFCAIQVYSQSAKISSKHVSVQSATQRKWMPGTVQQNSKPAGGMIHQLEIKIKTRKAATLKFEKMIVDEQSLDIEIIKGSERNFSGPLLKGNVFTVQARSENASDSGKIDSGIQEVIQQKQGIEGWLVYSLDGKKYLVAIKKFQLQQNEKRSQ